MPGAEHYGPGGDPSKGAEEGGVYSMSSQDLIDQPGSPDEASSLLAAGARYDSADSDSDPLLGKDTWVGDEEFAHLPWHRKPSVCDRCSFSDSLPERMLIIHWSRSSG